MNEIAKCKNCTDEMIEEMAKDIYDIMPDLNYGSYDIFGCYRRMAERHHKQGYRKIPEVVYENKRIYLNNKLIGYIAFSFYEDIKALGIGDFEIIDKRKGYGSFVVKDIIAKYKNEYDLIYCFVDKDNIGAIEFYKKVGKVCFDKINDKNQYYVILYENKIPEGSVVLSKEEYSDYLILKNNYAHAKDEAERLTKRNWSEDKHTKAYERLAELEDKIENGTLIELPCKVGDTVYSNERIMFEPVIVKVITTHQSINLPVSYTVFTTAKDGYGIYLSSDNFNEDWFITKAEAKAKLAELKG